MTRRRMAAAIAAVVVPALLAGCGGGSRSGSGGEASRPSGSGRTPGGPLIGVMFDGPVLGPGIDLGRQLDLAVESGVESLRVAVNWAAEQPYPSMGAVPAAQRAQFTDVGGVPTRFDALDRLVAPAASRGLSLLPVVLGTPPWAAAAGGARGSPAAPPRAAAYAAFLAALVARYGPGGSYWTGHPSAPALPIRMWQVWNEPNFSRYWALQPFARSYVAVLAAAHAALKRADPGSELVLAGLPEFSWQYLAQIYAVPQGRESFDVAAVHPYTAQPAGVITILRRVRAVMNRAGDARKPLLATEITWNSSLGKAPPQFGIGVSEGQQARLLGQVMPLLGAHRRELGLSGFYWYTWMGNQSPVSSPYAFDYAGLLKYVSGRVSVKPALALFRHWALALEGCASKRGLATRCG